MRGTLTLLAEEAGDLLLVASLVTAAPAWIGTIEFLSALGLDGGIASFLTGAYVWGRGVFSAALLVRHARRGTLNLGGSWFADALARVTERSPFTAAYPMPSPGQLPLSSTPHAAY
jgi:hypothetical protein